MAHTHLSLAEFLKTTEWTRLSANQKFWIRSYLDCDDQVLAAQMAYPEVSLKNVRAFSYKVIKQKKIQAALNRYFNRSEKDICLGQLERDIARTSGTTKIKLLLQFAELKFGKPAKKKSKGNSNVHRK
jgi:hypothetical protein